MSNARRFCLMAGIVGFLAVVTTVVVQAKIVMAQPAPVYCTPITPPTNRQAQQVMTKGQELIEEKEFGKACEALQYLLSLKDDNFVQVSRGPKEAPLWVSIRAEANRLLGTMPAEGLKAYEQLYGREAAARLTEGRNAGDPQILAEVALRYFHTEAGAQATELLATRCLERDEFLMAALYFERLIGRPDAGKLSGLALFKAALAFYRTADRTNGDEAWKLLNAKAKRDGGVNLGDQVVSLDKLREEIDKVAKEEPRGVHDWAVYRGTLNRSGQAIAGTIDLEHPAFSVDTFYLPVTGGHNGKGWTEELVGTGLRTLEAQNQPILPAQHPIAVNGKLMFPVYDGLYAADLRQKDDKLLWWSCTDRAVHNLFSDPNRKQAITGWWNSPQNQGYKTSGPQCAIFQNSTTGTLSTDNLRVFVIDDLPLPPHPSSTQSFRFGVQPTFGSLEEPVKQNTLKCYNLESGKLMWDLGRKEDNAFQEQFKESLFLSAPLPLGGKLYVLNEKDGAIRLMCLEAKDTNDSSRPPEVLWTQTLANTKDKISIDMTRRLHAAHIAYGEGILVCPTNAGAVVAVDLLGHSLVWAHSYRDAPPPPPANEGPMGRIRRIQPMNAGMGVNQLTSEWRNSAPAIAEGKVVFTAPDANSILCVNLKDGRLVWKQPRAADDYYFAGIYQGKALVVGKDRVRAYKMTDGNKVWDSSEATGMPTGQGVAAGNVYYLPSRNPSREPEIVTVNLADGKVTGRLKSDKKDLLGNLIFHDGYLISQSASRVTAFPIK